MPVKGPPAVQNVQVTQPVADAPGNVESTYSFLTFVEFLHTPLALQFQFSQQHFFQTAHDHLTLQLS